MSEPVARDARIPGRRSTAVGGAARDRASARRAASAAGRAPHADTDTVIRLVREDLGTVSAQAVYNVLAALVEWGSCGASSPPEARRATRCAWATTTTTSCAARAGRRPTSTAPSAGVRVSRRRRPTATSSTRRRSRSGACAPTASPRPDPDHHSSQRSNWRPWHEQHPPVHDVGRRDPGHERRALPHRRARRARSCSRTPTWSRRCSTSTASVCPNASCTPKAAARTGSSRRPTTSRPSPRRRCSSPGTRTDLLVRFSTVAGELGSPDTARDPRGFAIKFYTEQGNYDMVGQQHPGLLHPGPAEVPGLHPLPEAPRRQPPARQQHAVGLLDPLTGVGPPGDDAHGRPGHPPERGGTWTGSRATPTCGSTPAASGSG